MAHIGAARVTIGVDLRGRNAVMAGRPDAVEWHRRVRWLESKIGKLDRVLSDTILGGELRQQAVSLRQRYADELARIAPSPAE